MAKTKDESPLVAAAAALDDELRALDELALEAKRQTINSDKSLSRAARALTDSVDRQGRIEQTLRALLTEIDSARQRQQGSMQALLEVAHDLEARKTKRDVLVARFSALGESATQLNTLIVELAERKSGGANDQEILERLRDIQIQMAAVAAEAETLMSAAETDEWPEIARQANAIRQQLNAARNKLALAHQNVAARAPS